LKKAHGKKPMMVFGHMVAFAHAHVKIVLTTTKKKTHPPTPPKKEEKNNGRFFAQQKAPLESICIFVRIGQDESVIVTCVCM
jgi:hypothetical protein